MSKMRQKTCPCEREFEVALGDIGDYGRFKRILDVGRHPVYVGPGMTMQATVNGGLFFYTLNGVDIAASLVNPHHNVLLVLNVNPDHRSHGLGTAIVKFLSVNWIRAIESRIGYFEYLGYRTVGHMHRGRRFNTQVMVRSDLIGLAGRLKNFDGCHCDL